MEKLNGNFRSGDLLGALAGVPATARRAPDAAGHDPDHCQAHAFDETMPRIHAAAECWCRSYPRPYNWPHII